MWDKPEGGVGFTRRKNHHHPFLIYRWVGHFRNKFVPEVEPRGGAYLLRNSLNGEGVVSLPKVKYWRKIILKFCFPLIPRQVSSKYHWNFFIFFKKDVPQRVPNSSSLLFHMLLQILSSFQLYSWVKRGELYNSKQNLLFWGASIVSIFLVTGQSNWLTAKKKEKKKKDLKL
jgi:hypothetical protein